MSISIALVTPSYNQGSFLEATLQSVLGQNYPALQYVVMDGGSKDNSPEILGRWSERLHFSQSAKDGGQYDAINAGFAHTTGEIMGWINADDLHTPWTLSVVGEIFETFPQVEWLTTRFPLRFDAAGRATHCSDLRGVSRGAFARAEYLPGTPGFMAGPIQQESTFWRRSLWDRAGGKLDTSLDSAGDFELWCRFAKLADPVAVSVPLAGFRKHGDQKTSRELDKYQAQAMTAFRRHFGEPAGAGSHASRNFCRDRLPAAFYPMAQSMGLLFPAKVIVRSRDNNHWELHGTLC